MMAQLLAIVLALLLTATPALADCTSPAATAGHVIYNTDHAIPQYCNGANWVAMGPESGSDPCDPANSPSPGDVCTDGSVYAGLSPDGNEPMYTTPADAGQIAWNNGTTNWIDTAMSNTSFTTGEANTALLVGVSDTGSPYAAAVYCDGLSAHSQTDWYLPAKDELNILYASITAIGGFNTTGAVYAGYYWSSSESSLSQAWSQKFSDGTQTAIGNKDHAMSVRCVRKGYVAGGGGGGGSGCTSPTADPGKIIYNTDHHVMQFCNGADWVAMGSESGSDPCDPANSPSPGDVCTDGSVYAGLSLDGNIEMYTTPADAGQYTWNNGTNNWIDTAMANNSYFTGEANTTLLVGLSDSASPYAAAVYCDGLTAHGNTDWYLPARDELNVLYTNKTAIGGFNASGSYPAGHYWSSSEDANFYAWDQRFSDGNQVGDLFKDEDLSVRCVRKGYVAAGGGGSCTGPDRAEGAWLYNTDQCVLQYCNSSEWVSIGITDPCDCGTASPGEICSDGSVYAGLSPDGNVKMYTTPADAGQYPWNNGNPSGFTTTNQTSATQGETNTANIIPIDSDSGIGGTQPHQASQTCADLSAHGHTDWYLPAKDELDVLYTNRVAIGGFDTTGTFPGSNYWSSSEFAASGAWQQKFDNGLQNGTSKVNGLSVRCVRK